MRSSINIRKKFLEYKYAHGQRNLILNGSCRVAQRGVGPKKIQDGRYSTVDRFKFYLNSNGEFISEQVEDAPEGLSHSLQIETVRPDTRIDSDNWVLAQYLLDEDEMCDLHYGTSEAKTICLSFYLKCSEKGRLAVNVSKPEKNRLEWTQEICIVKAGEWQRYEFQITPNDLVRSESGGFGSGVGVGFLITFGFGVSQRFKSPCLGDWIEGENFWAVRDQLDLSKVKGARLLITGLQLEIAANASEFELRSFKEELRECQRYFTPIQFLEDLHETGSASKGLANHRAEELSRERGTILNDGLKSLAVLCSKNFWGSVQVISSVNLSKQYKTSFLGVIWLVIPPMAMMAIYALIIPTITGLDPQDFAVHLLATLPVWQFLVSCVTTPSTSLIANADILKRCSISSTVFPIAELLKNTYSYIISFSAMLLFCLAIGLNISWHVVLLPFYMLPAVVSFFALGIGLSYLTPFVHDLKEFVAVAMNILIWCSAVLYPISLLPDDLQFWMGLNPLYIFLEPAVYLISLSAIPPLLVVIKLFVVMIISLMAGFMLYAFGRRRFIYYL